MAWIGRLVSWLALLLLAGCAGFDPWQLVPVFDAPATPPPGEPAITFVTPGPTLPGVEAPALMCTPPACVPGQEYACPSGDCPGGCGTICQAPTVVSGATAVTGPLAAAPTEWESLEGWLATLWRSNVNPAAVRAALQQSGMQRDMADWAAADLDGDLQDEWVLVLYDQSLPGVPFGAPGDLWVVNGDGVSFRYYTAPSSDIYEFLAPTIIAISDLTGDGRPELVTAVVSCGAHTCTSNYRIIGHADGQFNDLVLGEPSPEEGLAGNSIVMPTADARLEDVDGDGRPELLVHGGAIGSAGAGIVRPRTEVWGWDGTAVTRRATILDPTAYRHHVLYEANDRMATGDLAGALALYEAAINDGALHDDGFSYPPEQVRADVSAFAAFRLILIDLLQGETERAGNRQAWLQATYPDSAAAGAAATLIAGWAGPESAAALCESIAANLATLSNPTGALADMGYGNPSLAAGDFCSGEGEE